MTDLKAKAGGSRQQEESEILSPLVGESRVRGKGKLAGEKC